MQKIKRLILLLVLSTMFVSGTVHAFNVGKPNDDCRNPKFRSFNPPDRAKGAPIPEAAAGSEIAFTVSGFADIDSIKVWIKKIKVKAKIVNRQSFYQVTAKIPEELVGKFARIDMRASMKGKECLVKDGWLIKVVAPAGQSEAIKTVEKVEAVKQSEAVITNTTPAKTPCADTE